MCFTDPNQGVASADYLAANPELGTKVAVIGELAVLDNVVIVDVEQTDRAAYVVSLVAFEGAVGDAVGEEVADAGDAKDLSDIPKA